MKTTRLFTIDPDGVQREIKADGFLVKLWREMFTPNTAIIFAILVLIIPPVIDWIMGW